MGWEAAGQQFDPLDHIGIKHAHRAAEQLEPVRVEYRHSIDDDEVLVGAAAAHVELAGKIGAGHHPRQGVQRAEQILAPSGHFDHLARFDLVRAGLWWGRIAAVADDGDGLQFNGLLLQGDVEGGGLAGTHNYLARDLRLVAQHFCGQAVRARRHGAYGKITAAIGHGP